MTKYAPNARPRADEAFNAFIDRINDEWVVAARRLSPPVLFELLMAGSAATVEFWNLVDLDELGEPVTWTGSAPAPIWLDAAREYTEYWVPGDVREKVRASGDPALSATMLGMVSIIV